MAKATSGWHPEVDVARQAQTTADGCATVQVGPIVCAHLRVCALLSTMGQRWTAALLQRWHTVDLLCWQVTFLQCWHGSSTQRWQAVDHAVRSVDQASCRVARDHFLSLDPTVLTVDLLEQHLLAAETSAITVGAARGTPRTPFFEGCSPSFFAPSYASAAVVDVLGAEDVGDAFASAKRHSSKGKGGRGGGEGSGGGGGGSSGGGGGSGGGGRSGGFGGGGVGSGGGGGSGGSGSGGGRAGATQRGGSRGGQWQQQQRRSETPSPQQLREWFSQRGASGGSGSCPYVIRTGDRAGQTCRKPHLQHRCFFRLDDAWRAEFGDEAKCPHWAEMLRCGVAIFDLDYDVILAAVYALFVSAEGDCYLCVPPNPEHPVKGYTLRSGRRREQVRRRGDHERRGGGGRWLMLQLDSHQPLNLPPHSSSSGSEEREEEAWRHLLQLCHPPPTSPEPPHHFTLPPTAAGAAGRERGGRLAL
ncbi:unnamed protein product [Closterium sp. NIES-53]